MSVHDSIIERDILNAAQTLLGEVGQAFTMDQLEAKTNISKATIYRRVGGKKVLLEKLAFERGETFEKNDIRIQILKAARVVFGRKGLAGCTMEEIAREAEVGVATVYRYFGEKDHLLKVFIEEMTPRTTLHSLFLNPTEDITSDLETFILSMMVFFFENRDVLRLVYLGGETEKTYLESLREGSDSSLGRLTAYFKTQLDMGRLQSQAGPGELALALLGMVLAFAVIGPMHYGIKLENPERSSKLLVNIFIDNLRGEQ